MASSNRHWPSMFKSKPCNTHHQWQHDINPYLQKAPYTSGCEERSPEPKPRWNPKPEQIRILEAIFNSGMVNPPREEIRKIRAQLQEYGQVGDANVFYWFQNRKSRSKNKQRHLQGSRPQPRSADSAAPSPPAAAAKPAAAAAATTSSSSSSSEQSTGSDKTLLPVASMDSALTSMVHSALPATSMNPMYLHGYGPVEFGGESFPPQVPQGYCLSAGDLTGIISAPEHAVGVYPGLWGELMGQNQGCRSGEDGAKVKMQLHHLYGLGAFASAAAAAATVAGVSTPSATVTCVNASDGGATDGAATAAASFSSPMSEIQARSTVFTNEVAFEVAAGPLNVKEVFGDEAVLLDQSGHPVLTDEWGVTIHPLQHGASYYLV